MGNSKRSIQVRNKTYGADLERAVAKALRIIFPEAKRAGGGMASQGHNSNDVLGTPYWIQVRGRSDITVDRWWNDAENARIESGDEQYTRALVVTRSRGGKLMAHLPLGDYLEDIAVGPPKTEESPPNNIDQLEGITTKLGSIDKKVGILMGMVMKMRKQ